MHDEGVKDEASPAQPLPAKNLLPNMHLFFVTVVQKGPSDHLLRYKPHTLLRLDIRMGHEVLWTQMHKSIKTGEAVVRRKQYTRRTYIP